MTASEGIGGSGRKLQYRKFHLNLRKPFFFCKGAQTLEQVVQRVMESSSLETLKIGHGSEQPVVVNLALRRGAGLDDLQRHLPVSTIVL